MNIFDDRATRDSLTEQSKAAAQRAVEQMSSSHITTLTTYLEMVAQNELIKCATLEDERLVRRSQGAIAAYRTLMDLLAYEATDFQSSVVQNVV